MAVKRKDSKKSKRKLNGKQRKVIGGKIAGKPHITAPHDVVRSKKAGLRVVGNIANSPAVDGNVEALMVPAVLSQDDIEGERLKVNVRRHEALAKGYPDYEYWDGYIHALLDLIQMIKQRQAAARRSIGLPPVEVGLKAY